MAAAGSRQPPPEDEAPGAPGAAAPAAAAAGGGGESSEGRAEGGGCYLALCARPVHFEKANPVNCVFFDEANKQVGAAGPCGAGAARPGLGLSSAHCCSSPWLCSCLALLCFPPAPRLPGVSPVLPLRDLSSC